MYLFTRSGQLRPGPIRKEMAFVGAITEKVRQETGADVHVWTAVLSPELGRVSWSLMVESLEEISEVDDKLAVSEGYLDLVEQGEPFWAGPLQDSLSMIVHGEVDRAGPQPAYATVARARAANGRVREAIANGIEIATLATEITGIPTLFAADSTGPYGGCGWLSGAPDLATVASSEAALVGDARWLELIDRVGPSYENDASQSIFRRLT